MTKTREELVKAHNAAVKQCAELLTSERSEARRAAARALSMFDLRAKAKARLMVKLLVASVASDDSPLTPDVARGNAEFILDAMTDEEVALVDW